MMVNCYEGALIYVELDKADIEKIQNGEDVIKVDDPCSERQTIVLVYSSEPFVKDVSS